jgi:hypothetical protein
MDNPASNIYEAINRVMAKVGYVQKERGGGLKFSFASESALIAALRPEMVAENITMFCIGIADVESREYESSGGTHMVNISLTGHWQFTHAPSGTSLIAVARGEGSDSSDKANNKAMTGSMKYALRQTFMIETGDDPDKDQTDERKTVSKKSDEQYAKMFAGDKPKDWPKEQIDDLLTLGQFANIFELRNALKLSNELKPGITSTEGVTYWITQYKQARIEAKLGPAESAEHADFEYVAEKNRRTQDKAVERTAEQ